LRLRENAMARAMAKASAEEYRMKPAGFKAWGKGEGIGLVILLEFSKIEGEGKGKDLCISHQPLRILNCFKNH